MQVYVFWRIATVPFVTQHLSKKSLVGIAVILWLLFYLGRVVGHDGTGVFSAVLEFLGMTWMVVLFLSFISVLVIDLITLFGFLLPKAAPSLRGWMLVISMILSGIALFQGLRPPVIIKYDVSLSELPTTLDGTVIAAISDTHIGNLIGKRWLAARLEQVKAIKPDLVVLLGDIVEGHGPLENQLLETFRKLSAPMGVLAVTGNHEFHGGGSGIRLYEDVGFRLLQNEWFELKPGLILAGVDDLTSARRKGKGKELITNTLKGLPTGGHYSLVPHAMVFENGIKSRCGFDDFGSHPCRTDLAIWLSGPSPLPFV